MNTVTEVLDGQKGREPAGRRVHLTEVERIYILKKLFNIPIHMNFLEQVDIVVELADKLGTDDLVGDVLTIYRRYEREHTKKKN